MESLCFHECADEALGSKGSEGGAGGKAIAGTPPHQSLGTQGLQRGDRAMEVGDWREGGREGGRKGGREGGREEGREEGREGGREERWEGVGRGGERNTIVCGIQSSDDRCCSQTPIF